MERLLREVEFENNNFRIVQCKKCGLVFTNPQPSPEWIKNSHYNAKEVGFYSYEGVAAYHSHYENGLKIINKYYKTGKLLDVGCGVGYFVDMAKKRGYDISGIDFSSVAKNVAKREFGLSITVGELCNSKFRKDSFDIITLWNVLEHFYDPLKEIELIYELLKNNGILLIETPNFLLRSMLMRFKPTKYLLEISQKDNSLIPWEHLYYWNQTTLKSILRRIGFRNIFFNPINSPNENLLYNISQMIKKLIFVLSGGRINLYFPMVVIAVK